MLADPPRDTRNALLTLATSRLTTGPQELTSSGGAIVTDAARIHNTLGLAGVAQWPTVTLAAHGGDASGVVVGIGPADDVDRYLAGSAVDRTTDLNLAPFTLSVARQPGTAIPAPPTARTSWVASASSRSNAILTWQVQNGTYRIVVMNADGAAGLRTAADLSLTLPHAFTSLSPCSGGAAVTIAGVAVIIRTATNRRRAFNEPVPWRKETASAPPQATGPLTTVARAIDRGTRVMATSTLAAAPRVHSSRARTARSPCR